jgi:hypothetical protein
MAFASQAPSHYRSLFNNYSPLQNINTFGTLHAQVKTETTDSEAARL